MQLRFGLNLGRITPHCSHRASVRAAVSLLVLIASAGGAARITVIRRLGLLVSLLAFPGCADRPTPVLASIIDVQQHDSEATLLRYGQLLESGANVRVPAGSVATVALVPGIYGRISGPADLNLAELWIRKNGNEPGPAGMLSRLAAVELKAGHLFAVVAANPSGSESRLLINIPGAEITAPDGASFSIRVATDRARLTCARGQVTLAAGHHQQSVTAGHYVDIAGRAGNSPAHPAELDGGAQDELVATFEAEAAILTLVESEIVKPRPWRVGRVE